MSEYDVLPELDTVAKREEFVNAVRTARFLEARGYDPSKVAAAGAASLGLAGTASADPGTSDSEPEIGVPWDRNDGWADGVDAVDTYARQLGQNVTDIGLADGTSYTINPENSNMQYLTLNGDVSLDVDDVPGSKDGCSLSLLFEGDGQTNAETTWANTFLFQNGVDSPSNLAADGYGIIGLRTYDGGSGWNTSINKWDESLYFEGQEEASWTGVSSTGNATSREADHLRIYIDSDVGDSGTWHTQNEKDLSQYGSVSVDVGLDITTSVSSPEVEFTVYSWDNNIDHINEVFNSGFSRTEFTSSLEGVTVNDDIVIEMLVPNKSSSIEADMSIYSVSLMKY